MGTDRCCPKPNRPPVMSRWAARYYCVHCACFWGDAGPNHDCLWCDGPLVRCRNGVPVFGESARKKAKTEHLAKRAVKAMLDLPKPASAGPGLYSRAPSKARRRLLSIADRDNWTCHLCGNVVDPMVSEGPARATLDHVIPKSHGGHGGRANLRLAHADCNSRRGNDPL